MGKEYIFVDKEGSISSKKTGSKINHGAQVRKILKLLFGSQSVMMAGIGLMALAVLNGDAFSSFTGGLVVNLNEFLTDFLPSFAYPVSLILAGLMLMAPVHYYVSYNITDVLIMIIIVYFFIGLLLGRMFRHPLWAFLGGIIVMASFMITISSLISIMDYIAQEMFSVGISNVIYGFFEGMFATDITVLFTLSVIENGVLIGIFGAFWGVILMPKNKRDGFFPFSKCGEGDICKV